jgi:hypothetical protein
MSIFILLFIISLEVVLVFVVKYFRNDFAWLITKEDECPDLEPESLKKFIDYSFDPSLGWTRKPNSTGIEKGRKGEIKFHIDSTGSRQNDYMDMSPLIAAFGDSYTFCRQVEDNETWESQLSAQEEIGVLNYGVGNYGIDQALLRYESTNLPDSIKIVVMGVVPETICRIESYWKHYLEFGNTFAFKPKFIIDENEKIILKDNLMKCMEDFLSYKDKLNEIKKHDRFYLKKFRSYQFRFPYIFSYMRHPVRNTYLLSTLIISKLFNYFGKSNHEIDNLAFSHIMKSNLRDAYLLYNEKESVKLLRSIILRFKSEAEKRGHVPVVVIIPQLLDLKINQIKPAPYQKFYNKLSEQLSVIDFTDKFKLMEYQKLYINDLYGGHLSDKGNSFVAKEIFMFLKENHESIIGNTGKSV